MKQLTFHYVTSSNPGAELIRWKTDSEFSHVEVLTDDGASYVGALLKGGVAIRPLDYQVWPLELFVTIEVTDAQHQDFWAYVLSKIGETYDTLGIVAEALGNNWHQKGELFCSEFMGTAVIQGTPPIRRVAKELNKLTPEEHRLIMTDVCATERRVSHE